MSQLRAGPILPLRSLGSLCSLRHGGSLAPALGTLSWSTRFSRRPGSRRYSVLKFNRDRDIPYLLCDTVRATRCPASTVKDYCLVALYVDEGNILVILHVNVVWRAA